jgi:hypothetical protein
MPHDGQLAGPEVATEESGRWTADPWVRLAIAAWLIALTAIGIRCAVQPHKRTLYTTWARAGADWVHGAPLYRTEWDEDQDQFRYSPLAAVLLVPFHYLPVRLGGVVWRLLNAAVLLGGLAWWLRTTPRGVGRADGEAAARWTPREWAVLFLAVLPIALGSLNNGQPNPLLIGLLLMAVAGAARGWWGLAAGCITVAAVFKVYPLAVGLLLAAAYPRRFAPWLALVLALAFFLPFACQRQTYVTGQYVLWLDRLEADQRWDWPTQIAYRDLWLLVRHSKLPLTSHGYQRLQMAAAGLCAVLCVAARLRRWGPPRVLLAVLVLGTCWMTLCGPATESSTYVLLAPALGWAVVAAGRGRWPVGVRLLPSLALSLMLACVLAGLFPWAAKVHALGLQPLAALFLTLGFFVVLGRELAVPAEGGVQASARADGTARAA